MTTRLLAANEETAYQQGIEDTADKLIELIYDSNFEITLEEIVSFLEAEKGYQVPDYIPEEFQ